MSGLTKALNIVKRDLSPEFIGFVDVICEIEAEIDSREDYEAWGADKSENGLEAYLYRELDEFVRGEVRSQRRNN